MVALALKKLKRLEQCQTVRIRLLKKQKLTFLVVDFGFVGVEVLVVAKLLVTVVALDVGNLLVHGPDVLLQHKVLALDEDAADRTHRLPRFRGDGVGVLGLRLPSALPRSTVARPRVRRRLSGNQNVFDQEMRRNISFRSETSRAIPNSRCHSRSWTMDRKIILLISPFCHTFLPIMSPHLVVLSSGI